MVFTPHILQVKEQTAPTIDEFGRVIASDNNSWRNVCRCRCDHNTTTEFTNVNGSVFRPSHHIVCDGQPNIKEGDVVRVEGICEGVVYKYHQRYWFNNAEIWL